MMSASHATTPLIEQQRLNVRRRRSRELALGDPLIRRTLEVWQPRTSERLTEEDARQMCANVTDFYQLLDRWDRARQTEQVEHRDAPANPKLNPRRRP